MNLMTDNIKMSSNGANLEIPAKHHKVIPVCIGVNIMCHVMRKHYTYRARLINSTISHEKRTTRVIVSRDYPYTHPSVDRLFGLSMVSEICQICQCNNTPAGAFAYSSSYEADWIDICYECLNNMIKNMTWICVAMLEMRARLPAEVINIIREFTISHN